MNTYEIQVSELITIEGQSYPDSREVFRIELANIDFKKFLETIREYSVLLNEDSYSINGKVSKIIKD